MFGTSPLWRRLVKLLTRWWAVFLWYGPMAVFLACRFNWQLSQGSVLLAWVYWPGVISAVAALGTSVALVFDTPRRAIVPFLLFSASATIIFSPLGDILTVKSFADYSKPEAAYVKNHCAPVDFVQDRKNYRFGVCDLITYSDGMTDFQYVYDTSGDVERYDSLPAAEQKNYVMMIRRYFKNNPNDSFEGYTFEASRYYRDFFSLGFGDIPSDGFSGDFGPPPTHPKSPYSPLF
jgi:hypothetical protein